MKKWKKSKQMGKREQNKRKKNVNLLTQCQRVAIMQLLTRCQQVRFLALLPMNIFDIAQQTAGRNCIRDPLTNL